MLKNMLVAIACVVPFTAQAVDVEKQFENEQIRVLKVAVHPGEEIGLHRDEYRRAVIGLQGGVISRISEDGHVNEIVFPTHGTVFLEADPEGELHRAVNNTEKTIEVIVVQLKS